MARTDAIYWVDGHHTIGDILNEEINEMRNREMHCAHVLFLSACSSGFRLDSRIDVVIVKIARLTVSDTGK